MKSVSKCCCCCQNFAIW